MTAQIIHQVVSAPAAAERQELLGHLARHLADRGYASRTRQMYLEGAAHFLHWRALNRACDEITADAVRRFLDVHLPRCTCELVRSRDRKTIRAALNQLLVILGKARRQRSTGPTSTEIEASVAAFDHYQQAACGLAASTRIHRCGVVRGFLWSCFGERPLEVARITAPTLIDFVSRQAKHYRPVSVHGMGGALHAYLRFLQFCGYPTVSLQGAIPQPPGYALSGLPTSLDETARARFWAAFDRSTSVGKRDYAMARCLADLGLRCCEVPPLMLDSIDWRKAQLRLGLTKARRTAVLPLPATTARAVFDYLKHGRPQTDSRALFVHHRAPFGQAVRKTTVRGAIRRAFARAGLPWTGTHVLRRTLATRLLEHGAPLTEIAEVLRHGSIDTTRIYTKVDQTRLATVAQPWPENVS